MADSFFPDQNIAFAQQASAMERRRELARSLIRQGMEGNSGAGYHGGRVYIVGNPLGNIASGIGGAIMDHMASNEQQDLAQRQQQANNDMLAAIPTSGPERQQAQLRAMQNPSLRDVIKAQMGFDEKELDRIEKGEQQAADRVARAEEAEANRIERGEQAAADRVSREELRRIPAQSIHITNSGNVPGGGKPLTAAQEKAALELGSNRSSLQMLADSFKDEYAGDVRSVVQRKAGEVLGGAAPQQTQDMTRWWANQAMFDELPQRHEMFGATLTAGEKASWAAATISPNMSPTKIRERLAIRQKIYDDAEARMRGSVEAGGKSVKQFDAAVGKPKPAAIKSQAEWQALKPGTPYTLPDGRQGVR